MDLERPESAAGDSARSIYPVSSNPGLRYVVLTRPRTGSSTLARRATAGQVYAVSVPLPVR